MKSAPRQGNQVASISSSVSSSPKSTLRGKRLDFSSTTPEPRCFSFDNRLKSPCLAHKEPDSPSLTFRQDNLSTEPRCFSFDSRLKEPRSNARKLNPTVDSQGFSFDSRLKEPGSAARKLNQEAPTVDSSQCFSFDNRLTQPGSSARKLNQESSAIDSRCFSFDNRLKDQSLYEEEDNDSFVRRCQSTLNQRSAFNNRISPPEYIHNGSNTASLAEHMGTKISDHIFMTPNKLSEEMIKCGSAIYSKLADPPSIDHSFSSPSFRNNSSFDDQLEFSGPYSSMIEVSHIHKNHRRGRDLDLMNRNFRSA
ncbi:hypothetical protein Rs2_16828 [Raphanus sativus]|nr:hypothetical protein Rs2_16828 [Raphanus sativus]